MQIRRLSLLALISAGLLALPACSSVDRSCGCPAGVSRAGGPPPGWASDSYSVVSSDLCDGSTFVSTRRRCTTGP